jgi:hypothetical protein
MGAELSLVKSEQGQSVIEFALLLPLLVAMGMIMIRVNVAMQVSIVNQQYARAQVLFLAFNSPYYPELGFQQSLLERKANQVVVGVSDTVYAADQGPETPPEATVIRVTRSKKVVGSNASKETPASRSMVRIRTTVTLCTQTYWMGSFALKDMRGPPTYQISNYHLNDSSKFNYLCGSPLAYE